MIWNELKRSILSKKFIVYLSLIIVYFILFIFISSTKNIEYTSTFNFTDIAWASIIVYAFPLQLIFLCIDVFTYDYQDGHMKNLLLFVKSKIKLWQKKFVSILVMESILLLTVLGAGFLISKVWLQLDNGSIQSYIQFFINKLCDTLPLLLLFVLISIVTTKSLIVCIGTYIAYLTVQNFISSNLFNFQIVTFYKENSVFISFLLICILIATNLIYIDKKEIRY